LVRQVAAGRERGHKQGFGEQPFEEAKEKESRQMCTNSYGLTVFLV